MNIGSLIEWYLAGQTETCPRAT